jgi:hypothetical protein
VLREGFGQRGGGVGEVDNDDEAGQVARGDDEEVEAVGPAGSGGHPGVDVTMEERQTRARSRSK